jgi:2-oxoglutarate dehydrogenase E1 component
VNAEILKSVGKAFTALPEEFTPHRQIKKVYEQRRAMIESGTWTDVAAAPHFSSAGSWWYASMEAPD